MPQPAWPSIRLRILLAFVALSIALTGAIAWLGVRAVGNVLDRRMVQQRADNAAGTIRDKGLSITPRLMRDVAQIVGADVIVIGPDVFASSLAPEEETNLRDQPLAQRRRITIRGQAHAIASAPLQTTPPATLFVLVDQRSIDDAQREAVRPIVLGAIPATMIVLLLAAWIAHGITRPISKLSGQIESAFAQGAEEARAVELRAPRELNDLADTYNRMLDRLRQTQSRLVESERLAAIGKLAASIAHEIRNPLAGIKMNLELLRSNSPTRGPLPAEDDEALGLSIHEVDRLDLILQELLVVARRTEPSMQPVDLRAIAQDMLALLGRRLEHARINAYLEGQAVALADPSQIKQVLLNLLINAIEAMPEGGEIRLRLSSSGQTARIEIEDSGSGLQLSPDADPFAWFTTSKSKGTGIGLAISRQIIDAHQGRIGLDQLPRGTRAWIELPINDSRGKA